MNGVKTVITPLNGLMNGYITGVITLLMGVGSNSIQTWYRPTLRIFCLVLSPTSTSTIHKLVSNIVLKLEK